MQTIDPPAPRLALKLPAGFEVYEDPALRPLNVSSAHVKEWLRFWWGGVNADTYLEQLVKTSILVPMPSPFRHKRFFSTEAVLSWAIANGAACSVKS